jgi:hypothetical protein
LSELDNLSRIIAKSNTYKGRASLLTAEFPLFHAALANLWGGKRSPLNNLGTSYSAPLVKPHRHPHAPVLQGALLSTCDRTFCLASLPLRPHGRSRNHTRVGKSHIYAIIFNIHFKICFLLFSVSNERASQRANPC